MIVLATEDNQSFDITGLTVKTADELPKLMHESPDSFNSKLTYYPVTFGRGQKARTTTITLTDEVRFDG